MTVFYFPIQNLLPNTKRAKDAAKQVVTGEGAGDFAKGLLGFFSCWYGN